MAKNKTAISFGLVHIPVYFNKAIRNNDTSFNFLHKKCHEKIKYKKYCPTCNKEVKNEDLVKGYEYEKDEYVIFTEEDFEKIKTNEEKNLEILSFINFDEIDPIYFEKSYILEADKNNKAFNLFVYALSKSKKVALIKTVLNSKTYYAILRFDMNNIIMTTLYFEEEVNLFKKSIEKNFTDEELKMALKLIDNMNGNFEPSKFKDDYQERIEEAISLKVKGKKIKKPVQRKSKSVKDLMEALELSLKEKKKI